MGSFSLFRVARFLSASCAPIAAIIGFSCLLTVVFILYQPTTGPGEIQRMGWQSWDAVFPVSTDTSTGDNDGESGSQMGNIDTSMDWWNLTVADDKVDTASFPLDVWNPLLPHDTGLSEITIVHCFFPSALSNLCAPSSTIEEDALKGKWVRVDRDLNKQVGMWGLYMYYRRTRRLDVPLITEIRLLPDDTEPTENDKTWHKVTTSMRDGVRGAPHLYLWYRTGADLREITVKGKKVEFITELDVLYGEDRPWYGFEKVTPSVTEKLGAIESVYVTYRKGVQVAPKAPPLHFSHDGRFKILQIADLHYSVSQGDCRDTVISPCTHSDNLTTTLLGRILDAENPDFVVFTGDQLNGQGFSWDSKSVLAKFSVAVEQRKIPWAAVFGNHDDENTSDRELQMKLMQALPYSMVEPGPKDIHGVGNYVLKVRSADSSKTNLLTLYFLDSGSYAGGVFDFFGFFRPTEYDYLHKDQINWFLQESASIQPIQRPYTPDKNDFGDFEARQSNQITPTTRRLAKPNAMMFFHIPLQESLSTPDKNTANGGRLDIGLHDLEGPGTPKKNDGFFESGLLNATESDRASLGADGNIPEVKVVANGHQHITENCRRVKGIWMCFGGGGSYSGYGKIGFDRRFRVYEISDYGETIRTWKRTEHDVVLNDMVLTGNGAAPSYQGS